jgi:Flp pilus assembly protein TadG
VEFALIVPLFIGTLVGLFFVALMMYSYVTLQLAVSQGANTLIHNPGDTLYTIHSTVCNSAFAFAPGRLSVQVEPPDTSSVTCPPNPSAPGEGSAYGGWQSGISVSVTGIYTVALPSLSIPTTSGSIIIFGPVQLSAVSIMTFD